MTTESTSPFPPAPPPWTTKCTTYLFAFHQPSTSPLPRSIAYTPLTASHAPFSFEAESGKYRGGLVMVHVVRYTETPVGPYDELVLLPGNFDVPVGKKKGTKNTRITAIWVSQKETCWNGRKNWNIPKHLARFKFTPPTGPPTPSSPLKIEVFPQDPSATIPFFTAHVQMMPWLPFSFPCSSAWGSYLGIDPHLVQPPLPQGLEPELCGTEDWKKSKPVLYSKTTRLVWVDLKQPEAAVRGGEEDEVRAGDGEREGDALLVKNGQRRGNENWWPGLKRWHVGYWFENGTLTLGEPEILT